MAAVVFYCADAIDAMKCFFFIISVFNFLMLTQAYIFISCGLDIIMSQILFVGAPLKITLIQNIQFGRQNLVLDHFTSKILTLKRNSLLGSAQSITP